MREFKAGEVLHHVVRRESGDYDSIPYRVVRIEDDWIHLVHNDGPKELSGSMWVETAASCLFPTFKKGLEAKLATCQRRLDRTRQELHQLEQERHELTEVLEASS